MNQTVANMIKEIIEDLSFVDKIAGLVSTQYMNITNESGVKVQKSYPVACDVTAEDCKEGAYNDLAPDSKYKTVIYFEDEGLSFKERKGKFSCYTSNLKLVCWINVALLYGELCPDGVPCTASAAIIRQILCALPEHPVLISPYSNFYPVVTSQDIRSNSIFSKYTYNETQTQFLMYPFDYFALNIQTNFCVCMDCDDDCTGYHPKTYECTCITDDNNEIIIN